MAKDTIELSPAHQQVWTLDLCGTKSGLYQRAMTLGEFPVCFWNFRHFFQKFFLFFLYLWKFCHILMHFKAFGLGAVFHNNSTNFLPIEAESWVGLLQRMLHQRIIWGTNNTMYTMSELLKNENKQLCDDQRLRNQSFWTR